MSIYRTNNPYMDFSRHEAEGERWLAARPICSECERPIQDDSCFEFNGDLICEDCLESHKRWTEDFIS